MEDSWFLSTPVSLNANTTALEMKETKTQRIIYSHWWNGKNWNSTNGKTSISTKYRNEKLICSTSKHSRWKVVDKEAKNYKEKETQHRHQTPVYSKQKHQPNLVIYHFPERITPFGNKEQYHEIVNIVTLFKTVRKRL